MSVPTSLELTKEEETLAMMANDKHNHPRSTASSSQLEHYRDQQRRSPRLLGQPPGPGLPYVRQQPPSGAVQQSIPVNPWPADQFQLPTAVPERPPTSTATPAIGYNESCFTVPERLPTSTATPAIGYNESCFTVPERLPTSTATPAIGYNESCFTVPERLPTSTAPPAVGYNGSCFPVPERPPTSTDTPAIGYNGSCFPVPERPPTSTVTPAVGYNNSWFPVSERPPTSTGRITHQQDIPTAQYLPWHCQQQSDAYAPSKADPTAIHGLQTPYLGVRHALGTPTVGYQTPTQSAWEAPAGRDERYSVHSAHSQTGDNTATVPIFTVDGQWVYLPLASDQPDKDGIGSAEMDRIEKAAGHLGESWKRDHPPFQGLTDPTLSLSSVLRQWYEFCRAQWKMPTSPAASRAFLSAALGNTLSNEIMTAQNKAFPTDLASRHYYFLLHHFAVSYLLLHHKKNDHVTALLQSLMTMRQDATTELAVFLGQVADRLRELQFASGAQAIAVSHLANVILTSLASPFNDWYYQEYRQHILQGRPVTIETILSTFRVMVERSRMVGPSFPMTQQGSPNASLVKSAPGMPAFYTQPSKTESKPTGSTSAKAGPAGQQRQETGFCYRCLKNVGHSDIDCPAQEPAHRAKRCPCGGVETTRGPGCRIVRVCAPLPWRTSKLSTSRQHLATVSLHSLR
ncbi:hypothetical protein FOZ60_010258 [Perkinsus olseni]|uniref:Uncharacterized protein n=2 Tax=Perkinsus olseni TaxID=32597 RepID=A0A7J6NFR4_PEROL|nr:hypothetical protein FOZ60_010258 [Perkinsus olseni]